MLKKLLSFIKEAIRKMVRYQDISDTISDEGYTISDEMSDALSLWKDMYKDKSPWLDEDEGVYSLGLPETICNEFKTLILDELKCEVVTPGVTVTDDKDDLSTRSGYLNHVYKKLLDKLDDQLEKGLALGGMIIKPYISSDSSISFDFIRQGDFYPITFDDDGNITDIAFLDQFISGDKIYSKVERQTFANNSIVIENKAYIADIVNGNSEDVQDLGTEVPLQSIDRWKYISEDAKIDGVEKPLYGYYKVPSSNTIDLDCPLGISIFGKAVSLIKRCDMQYSRLDWEYEGGQIAIDVDPTAVRTEEGYYGGRLEGDKLRSRIYRKLDLGDDSTYEAFVPSLRDGSYQSGLSRYLMQVEDKVGLARGTISEVQAEARTATEIKTLRQKTFVTVTKNQKALELALNNVLDAANVYATLYNLCPEGEYTLNVEWSDSVLSDTDTELNQKLNLKREGILGKAEVRAWYTGEDLETAEAKIAELESSSMSNMMNDLFTPNGSGKDKNKQESTLETDEDIEPKEEEEDKEKDGES